MELKPLQWLSEGSVTTAVVMGIELTIIMDKDGSYTVSCTAFNRRPEFQKMFSSIDAAKEYATNVLLTRELKRYFTGV